MRVIPQYAAASPINIPNIPNVMTTDKNIEAGVKMLRNIEDQCFNDRSLNPVGQEANRLCQLQRRAESNCELRKPLIMASIRISGLATLS